MLNVALPVFGIVLAGYLSGRFQLLGRNSSEALNSFVYYFALPPYLFIATARAPVAIAAREISNAGTSPPRKVTRQPSAAAAMCHARRSASPGSVITAASARWAARRSEGEAA